MPLTAVSLFSSLQSLHEAQASALYLASLNPLASFGSPESIRLLASEMRGKLNRELNLLPFLSPHSTIAPRGPRARIRANGFDKFVGKLLRGVEDATRLRTAKGQESKRVNEADAVNGSALPMEKSTINSMSVPALPLLGALEETTASLLSPEGATSLELEFSSFLTQSDSSAFRTNSEGEIIFSSKKDLTDFVIQFSYGKLAELAVSTRAAVRYINDLELDLEQADENVANLRRELETGASRLSEAKSVNAELTAESSRLSSELSQARRELEKRRSEMESAERAVDEAANSFGQTNDNVDEAQGLRLENDLIAAQAETINVQASTVRLESELESVRKKEQRVKEELAKEAKRVSELERKLEIADATAEETALKCATSDSQVAMLQKQLEQLKKALNVSKAKAAAAPHVKEAEQLTKDIQDRLDQTGHSPNGARSPLSSMGKEELIAECKERDLQTEGTVAELRFRLRVERKRDGRVAETR